MISSFVVRALVHALDLHSAHGAPHACHGVRDGIAGHGFERTGVEVQCAEVHSDISLNLLVHAQLSYPVHHDPAKPHGSSGNNQFLLLAYST